MDRPMTSWPCSASSAAATDESTPPDMATTIRTLLLTPASVLARCRYLGLPGQSSKLFHQARQNLNHPIDLGIRREHAEAEAQRVLRAVRRKAHRAQDVGRLERARGACRSGRHGDAFEVERDEQALRLHAIEADVRGVRHAARARAVNRRARDAAQ